MRIDAGRISFSTPTGFKDVTGYYFMAREDKERFEIGGGLLPSGVTDLDAMVGYRRAMLEGGALFAVAGTAMTELDGVPARTFSFTFEDGTLYRGRLAIALDPAAVSMGDAPKPPGTYVQIAYMARADDEHEAERFAHAVASASFTSATPATPVATGDAPKPPEGWVRRWAGRLWLDVPGHLDPPRTYMFVSPDETTRVEVALVDPNDEPGIERELARDLALGGTVKDRTRADLTTPLLSGVLHGYTITHAQNGVLLQDVVRRAHLLLRDVPVAHVYGRAPSIDAPALEAALDALVQGIEETGRR